MPGTMEWVLLAYRLPREPSTPRITLWRKLRRLGVVQVLDGLVGLPADARTREQLEWLAEEVCEAGGEATVWLGRLASAASERAVAARMAEAVTAEYLQVVAEAADAGGQPPAVARRAVARLRRDLQRIGARDFFPPPERDQARAAVQALAAATQSRAGAEPAVGGSAGWPAEGDAMPEAPPGQITAEGRAR
ncbi:MAG TPA: Chromate resistance protein ChrB [Kineosporiaceae bacterium]